MLSKIGKLRIYEEITQPHLAATKEEERCFVSLDFFVLFDQAKRTITAF
jgi:hypothetical protein